MFLYPSATGDRFYAYHGTRTARIKLGTYSTLELAEAAILAYGRADEQIRPLRYDEIVEEWVADICAAFPVEQRRGWFNAPWDPIVASAVRMDFVADLTLDQIARMYGVSRQRINQVEFAGVEAFPRILAEFRDHSPADPMSPLSEIESGW